MSAIDEALRDGLGPRLFALVGKELLRPDRSLLTEGDAYRFRHVLIRDAAYAALPRSERAELHERVAELARARGGRAHRRGRGGGRLPPGASGRAPTGARRNWQGHRCPRPARRHDPPLGWSQGPPPVRRCGGRVPPVASHRARDRRGRRVGPRSQVPARTRRSHSATGTRSVTPWSGSTGSSDTLDDRNSGFDVISSRSSTVRSTTRPRTRAGAMTNACSATPRRPPPRRPVRH